MGACCDNIGGCNVRAAADCGSPSVFLGAGTGCVPNPCGSPAEGACCDDQGTCTAVREVACEGDFLGVGRPCMPNPCPPPPPTCPADFNESGEVSVQDIFDFLAAYFSGDPDADFNGQGGLSVQDIFDFLAAFFTPCT
jgi:hypothetical protein